MAEELGPDTVIQTPPTTLAEMRENAMVGHDIAKRALANARKQRDTLNETIASLVREEAELRRVVAALTRQPRARKAKS